VTSPLHTEIIFKEIVPAFREAGFTDAAVDLLLIEAPKRFLATPTAAVETAR
jgi:predicted metal-dependent phosphotriesterase family hydrolase